MSTIPEFIIMVTMPSVLLGVAALATIFRR